MRLLNIKWDKCGEVLTTLNLMNVKRCHEWVETIIDEDDLCVIMGDERGTHKRAHFYESCPSLEMEAKQYALISAKSKKCDFDTFILAKFIDKRFKEMYSELIDPKELLKDKLVRSRASCRVDLLRWGATKTRKDLITKATSVLMLFQREKNSFQNYWTIKIFT